MARLLDAAPARGHVADDGDCGPLWLCPKGHAATKLRSALLPPFFQPTSSGLLLRDTGSRPWATVRGDSERT
jgi:hypothetical protein